MSKSINKVIKTLIVSDFILNSGWGLLAPVFAIFLIENIQGGDAKVVGIAAMIFWVTKSLIQIPVGRYLDINHGEKDDFYFILCGTILASFVPFGFLMASLPWHIYLLQIFHAIAMAIVIPAWSAVFTRHIDKGQEAHEWGTYSTFYGFSVGIAGALGGLIVTLFGFKMIFTLVGILTMVAVLFLLIIRKEMFSTNKLVRRFPPPEVPF